MLSGYGRDDTAERWYESDHGPQDAAFPRRPANCVSCGFFVPLSGGLGRLFGACGNAFAPDDGRVVSADHGCGAHSEAAGTGSAVQAAAPVIDEFGYDLVDLPGVSVEETVLRAAVPGHVPGVDAEKADRDAPRRAARPRLSTGTYHSANSPIARPVTHVHTHHHDPAGSASRAMSTTTRATAHAAVPTPVTRRSFASRGGGGGRRSPRLTCWCWLTQQG